MKVCQQGVKMFSKTCSFEVSIVMLPLISIVLIKESLFKKSCENPSTRAEIFNKMYCFKSEHRVVTPDFNHLIKRIPV